MTSLEFYKKLTERIPKELSCSWDGDGFEVCADKDREVGRVLVSLDITNEVIDKAIDENFDVIVAHHPLFFKGIKEVSVLSPDGERAVKLVKNNISVMTFHTRLDAVEGGVNDTLASCLGLLDVETLEYNGENMIRVGNLENEMKPEDFAALVKERLGAPAITLSLGGKNVKRIALLGGSGGGDIGACRVCLADTYVTGEMRYHELLSSGDRGVNLIEAGHFYTEYPVCEILKKFIGEIDPSIAVEVYFSDRVKVI